nr:hypothetical protein [Tanacetum cinerariifolium]
MIPILDTGKLEKWKLRIQQYLENEHYALWEVIEFGDSYKAPPKETCKGPASESSTRMKGRTVAITTEDMHKRRNDVKARKTLLLALPDKHQLRFSKYETAKELWEAILKTFETLEQTFNRLQVIVSHLEFIDVEIEQDDLNQKFLTSLAPEWPMKNTKNLNTKISKLNEELSDCETDLYNYKRGLSQVKARLIEFKENEVKFYERIRVLKRDIEIKDNKIEYLKNELEQVKKEKESLDNKLTRFGNASKDLDDLLGSQRSDKNKEGLGYSAVPPSPAQIYLPPKKELSWTGTSRIELFKEYSWPVLDWPHWRLTKRAIRIAQSKALSPDVDEPASLLRDDRHGEAFLTVSSLDAGQDRDIEISGLKARVKSLDDKESRRKEPIQGDAPITGGIIDIREELGADKSTEKESNDIKEMVNVLSSMEAANILSSGGAA